MILIFSQYMYSIVSLTNLYMFSLGWLIFAKPQLAEVISLLFVCFVALRPKSTAMVIAGRSVHLTTLFPGQA